MSVQLSDPHLRARLHEIKSYWAIIRHKLIRDLIGIFEDFYMTARGVIGFLRLQEIDIRSI